ncbi:ejaculatory bulb-specific protein 3-like [Orussus abietinus]|uniref:ejaculatory bulb-specific protein 3-like n=1 Tax=Orussus abietinus TaxID=222816 RepID=UPI0006260E5A|nr:ejaculatory bulb-specific protein 3-like [Orussus abietinus]
MAFSCVFRVLFTVVAAAILVNAEREFYSEKYDHIDVDEILANPRTRNQYYKCVYGSAPCVTAAAKYLKDKFPEAIVTNCKYCTERQKVNFGKLVTWFVENDEKGWNALLEKLIDDYGKGKSTI